MLYLDYLSYNNRWRHISILEKLLLGGGGLALAITAGKVPVLAAILVITHVLMLAAGTPPGYLARLWVGPFVFLAVTLATLVVSIDVQAFPALYSVKVGGLYAGITEAGLNSAQFLAMRSMAAVSCLFLLATTTPVMYIVAFCSRLRPLRVAMEIALLAYRFIFVILTAAGRMYTAQQSRLGYADTKRSLSSLSVMAANLGRMAFLTARDLNTALLARNYQERLVLRYPPQQVNAGRMLLIALLWAGVLWAGN